MEKINAAITIESTSSSSPSHSSTSSSDPSSTPSKSPSPAVRVVKMSEYKAAAQTLAEAFATDDVVRYFIDTPDRTTWSAAKKWRLHVKILEYIVYAHCLKGMVLTAGEGYGCVALWYVVPGYSPVFSLSLTKHILRNMHTLNPTLAVHSLLTRLASALPNTIV